MREDQFGSQPHGGELKPLLAERCSQMATAKTCPHGPEDRVALSGTEVRRMLTEGEEIPKTFSRREVAAVLREG